MKIPVYRIQNVLNAFGKHLAGTGRKEGHPSEPLRCQQTSSMAQNRSLLRQTIVEQVENEMIARVHALSRSVSENQGLRTEDDVKMPQRPLSQDAQMLKYCRIDEDGNKEFVEIDLIPYHR